MENELMYLSIQEQQFLEQELEHDEKGLISECFQAIGSILKSQKFFEYFSKSCEEAVMNRNVQEDFIEEVPFREVNGKLTSLRVMLRVGVDYLTLSTTLCQPNMEFSSPPNKNVRNAIRREDEFAGVRYYFKISFLDKKSTIGSVQIGRDIGVLPAFEHQGYSKALFICSHLVHRIMLEYLSKQITITSAVSKINDEAAPAVAAIVNSIPDNLRTKWTSKVALELGYIQPDASQPSFIYHYQ